MKGGSSPLEEQHKQNVTRISEHHNRVFSVVLPGILEVSCLQVVMLVMSSVLGIKVKTYATFTLTI